MHVSAYLGAGCVIGIQGRGACRCVIWCGGRDWDSGVWSSEVRGLVRVRDWGEGRGACKYVV